MIFRFLPDAKIAWSDVWLGAGITTVLFIAREVGSGSVSGQRQRGFGLRGGGGNHHDVGVGVLLGADPVFGAEFTQVYANEFGSHIEPVAHAVRVEKKEVEIPG